jgi:hypothetical protein
VKERDDYIAQLTEAL